MKTLNRISILLALAFSAIAASGQAVPTQTSLTAAMTATQNYALVTSATNFAATRAVYIDNELMIVGRNYATGLNIPVTRNSEKKSQHASGAMVLMGKPNQFSTYDPFGGCTAANVFSSPWINVNTGNQWLCSTVLNRWVPGWANDIAPAQVTAAVASAAGLITPSGQLFHVTGTAAITGFTIPLGFAYGSFTIIPDGIFTTTTANNIAIASTAVVSKPMTFIYDPNSGKFYPSY